MDSYALTLAQRHIDLVDYNGAIRCLIKAIQALEEQNALFKTRLEKLEPTPRTHVPYLGDREP